MILHVTSSSLEDFIDLSMVILHVTSSSLEDCIDLSIVILHVTSSSLEDCIDLSMVILHVTSSSLEDFDLSVMMSFVFTLLAFFKPNWADQLYVCDDK